MQDLFADQQPWQPLASRMRPRNLDEYIGQTHLLGPGQPLRQALSQGRLHSMILWGPPGVGKTTLARLLANLGEAEFVTLSAVLAGVKDIREMVEQARQRQYHGRKTLLFVDEVHRFNKAQQDAFLPHIEDGTLLFVGATTENPSFALNNALLSRARVYLLKPIEQDAILTLLQQALQDPERGLGQLSLQLSSSQLQRLALAADGDARSALNLLEVAADLAEVDSDGQRYLADSLLDGLLKQGRRRFDNQGDVFYDQISAFHKSVRGSSADGALYWYARLLDGGCDPLYVARRLLAIASEDIGLADPRALEVTLNAWDIFERVGPAEGERAIAEAAVYCAVAPKSNALYSAWKAAKRAVQQHGSLEVPAHLRNAPTQLMSSLGYGAEYRYAHDEPDAYAAGECYLPEPLAQQRFYQPSSRGLERKISDKLEYLRSLDQASPRQRLSEPDKESP